MWSQSGSHTIDDFGNTLSEKSIKVSSRTKKMSVNDANVHTATTIFVGGAALHYLYVYVHINFA